MLLIQTNRSQRLYGSLAAASYKLKQTQTTGSKQGTNKVRFKQGVQTMPSRKKTEGKLRKFKQIHATTQVSCMTFAKESYKIIEDVSPNPDWSGIPCVWFLAQSEWR